jgi:hypothetical protein
MHGCKPRQAGLQDALALGPALGPNSVCVRTHFAWVLHRDPILLSIGFINIIICVINIIIFLIIQSIHLKNIINIIIFVL